MSILHGRHLGAGGIQAGPARSEGGFGVKALGLQPLGGLEFDLPLARQGLRFAQDGLALVEGEAGDDVTLAHLLALGDGKFDHAALRFRLDVDLADCFRMAVDDHDARPLPRRRAQHPDRRQGTFRGRGRTRLGLGFGFAGSIGHEVRQTAARHPGGRGETPSPGREGHCVASSGPPSVRGVARRRGPRGVVEQMLVGAEMGISGLVDRQTLAEGEAAPGRQPPGSMPRSPAS